MMVFKKGHIPPHKGKFKMKNKMRCECCGKEFSYYKYDSKNRRFCSKECYIKIQQIEKPSNYIPRKLIKCLCGCGNSLLNYSNGHKRMYIHGHNGRKKNGKMIECKQCNNEFYIQLSLFDKKHFCSKECYRIFKMKPKIELECKQCNSKFLVKPHRNDVAKFCSKKCFYEFESTSRIGKDNPMYGKPSWNKNLTKKTDERIMKGSIKQRETRKTIDMTGENNPFYGKKHTKDSIKKIKKARSKQVFPMRDTGIELKIQDFLTMLKVEFITHKYINIKHAYQCDILIPTQEGITQKIVIECDGDFYHMNPDKFSPNDRIHKNGITAKEKWDLDEDRTQELLQKGFIVMRFWENEIVEMTLNDFQNKMLQVGRTL